MKKENEFLLSKEEKQILDAILSLEMYPSANEEEVDEETILGDRLISTLGNIWKRGRLIHSEPTWLHEWQKPFELLQAKDLVQKDNPNAANLTYTFTTLGRSQAKQVRQERIGNRFSDILVRSEESKAYSSFCQQVFGKDLSQANMMDMEQLDKLLKVLNLSSRHRVLDLACGIGRIAEYISDVTHAHVLGIDLAAAAIKRAQERTLEKKDRIEFQVGDINDLPLDLVDVDTVIGIAVLHYIDDLDKAISHIKKILPPTGQMAFFTFQYRTETDPPEILLPENTRLGKILKNNDLKFQTWDFTTKEIEIRQKQLQVGKELMGDFQMEGNKDLCEDRIEECETDLPRLETGTKRRYLYHVRL
ncbi:MAG: methyltransferase domain-containing protein [Candidatus Heimdallarchaeota archaeon]|nr:MAG: methyltransferase domain-containing protein [Candidatus Heimdallarchaeota archaeon]